MSDHQPTTDPGAPRFPAAWFLVCLAVFFATLAALLWQVRSQHREFEAIHARQSRLRQAASVMARNDAIMSTAARMAASTGNITWEERYRTARLELNEAMAEAAHLSGDMLSDDLVQASLAFERLVEIEAKALELVRRGESGRSMALLMGDEYAELNALFAMSLERLEAAMRTETVHALDAAKSHTLSIYIVALLAGLLMAGSLLLAWRLRIYVLAVRARDAEAHAESERILADSERRFRRLYTRTPALLHSIDAKGRLLSVSDHWLETLGYERKDVIGRPSSDFLTDESRRYAKEVVLPEFFRTGSVTDVPYQVVTGDGRILDMLLSATSEVDEDGSIVRSLAVMVDVTQQLRAEAALARSEQRLALAVRSGRVGFWDWMVETEEVFYNERWAEIIGFSLDELEQSYATWASRIHSQDRALTLQSLTDHLGGKREFFEAEHRMLAKSGEYVWVLGVGQVSQRDDDGTPQRVTGVMLDITDFKQAQARLAESEQRFRNVTLTTGDWIWQLDHEARYAFVSDSVTRLMGYTPEEFIGRSPFEFIHEHDHGKLTQAIKESWTPHATVRDLECWHVTRQGTLVCMLINGVPMLDDSGRMKGYFGVAKDITRRKDDRYKIELFETIFQHALEGMTLTDAEGSILSVNQAFTDITGYSETEALGRNPRILKSDRHDEAFYKAMWSDLHEKGFWEGEIWNRRKNGEAFPEWLSIAAIKDDLDQVSHYVAVFHDISEMKHKEETIQHQANHDALTGLPNRDLLLDRLSVSLAKAGRNDHGLAVLFMDLDNFKTINDSLGHAAGDALLRMVADLLRQAVGPGDTVSRQGGDEFVILQDGIDDPRRAVVLAEHIIGAFREPMTLAGRELFITPSIGIAMYPEDGVDPETLIKHADLAMYRAKERGRNNYSLFAPDMHAGVQRRLDLEHDLRRALQRFELHMHYQPKIDLATGRMAGMEALVRWQRNGRLVSPGEFIPLAEETGLILPLGRQVLGLSCAQCRPLLDTRLKGTRVAVNLSTQQFMESGVVDMIGRTLEDAGMSPQMLEIEITETSLAGDIASAASKVRELRDMGVDVSVDDFGTGYSSLSYLRHLPLSSLKIDRSFIVNLADSQDDRNIVWAIVQLAGTFGLKVVAEGVETEEQLWIVQECGCHMVQGYYYSKPLPFDEFEAYAMEHSPAPGA